MSKALNSTGRPMVYSMCNWGVDGPWNFATTISNSWRTSGDLINVWNRDDPNCLCTEKEVLECKLPGYHCSIMNVLNMAAFMPSKAYAGAWNDLDLLQVGNGGLTDDESVSHFSLWAAVKSPLIMSNVMTQSDSQTLSILQNPAIIAINQDPASAPAIRGNDFQTEHNPRHRGYRRIASEYKETPRVIQSPRTCNPVFAVLFSRNFSEGIEVILQHIGLYL